jgi:hypothetical protein
MLASHPDGTVLEVWVVPGAARDEIVGEHDGALKVRVSAPAEGGRANRSVIRLIGAAAPGHRVTLLSGTTSRRKRVLIEGAEMAAIRARLGRSAT